MLYGYQPFNRGKIIREKNTQKISFFKEVFFLLFQIRVIVEIIQFSESSLYILKTLF